MPRYCLVAARDGDLINDIRQFDDEEAAQAWAMKEAIETFRLDSSMFQSFEDLPPETDGFLLEELAPDPVAEAAINLLDIALDLIGHMARHPPIWDRSETRGFITAASRLTLALDEAGYNNERLRWP